ncbi:MAG: hypothetical protein WC491_09145 [Candidatus Omnitrophota bacterium]|jgi:hypothetical protein|nr:hypothetical protein [Sphaerochaeta sp.]
MRLSDKWQVAIDTKATTTTSSAINCENYDGVFIKVNEDTAVLAGSVQVFGNIQEMADTTFADTAPDATWVAYGDAKTLASPGNMYVCYPVPPNIKITFTHATGTASVHVQGFLWGSH